MTTVLYLIRHGETDWNVHRRWQGHTDIPLNERGLKQARLLAQRLQREGVRFNGIYSSDLARAYQTAWEVGAALKVAVQMWPPLREIDVGAWSGLTRDEIRTRFADEYARLEQGEDIRRGGGETGAALYQRVTATIEAMVKQHPGETIALVSHGGPIRALVRHVVEDYGAEMPPKEHIGNTSITTISCLSYMWKLETHNDMRHLFDEETGEDLVSMPPDDAEQHEENVL